MIIGVIMLNLGIIGTGLMANVIAAVCKETDINIYSVLSRTESSARLFCQKYNIEQQNAFSDLDAFFRDVKLEAVYIATPTSVKHKFIAQCLIHKKHVLIEKPLHDMHFFSKFCNKAQELGLVWLDAAHFIHNEWYEQLHSLIETNVGLPSRIDASFFWPDSDNGQIKFNPDLEPDGALGDLGWYPMRLLSSVIGSSRIKYLSGFLRENYRKTIVEFNAIGCSEEGITFSLASTYRGTVARQQCVISGEKGEISMQDFVMPYCGSFVYGKMLPSMSCRHSWGLKPLIDFEEIPFTFSGLQHKSMLQNFHRYTRHVDTEKLYIHQRNALNTLLLMEKMRQELFRIT
ncbi:Gfo/Idh/MocA family oxidoreductase [Xenorhabdus khoisanae]|uniref:Gfo/Idh/MocA family protein n=1 Tax=Xenorhabdus khoisanae TaxID=880157 RepID=UPI00069D6569|nr:Gfo/Idh/MocA family oxidoreductase [Xenorhabdus khoisanae]